MSLALFDLDNTLIAGDSDYEWGKWLVHQNKVDAHHYQCMNEHFYQQYQAGELDIFAYLEFALAPLASIDPAELQALQTDFMAEIIQPMWLPRAEQLLSRHRQQGDNLVIISATNRFIVEPICRKLGVREIIATEPEMCDGRYTGKVRGIPSYREGKVERLEAWLVGRPDTLEGSYFYSDSLNDLALLQTVDHPVAVDPDPQLKAEAEACGWPIISLRD
ncbi:MAG TPA: HAD-IB family hydrolase [Porticoccaceae bacterium]|nr:HAD-IB family hydrolase [Porticoccaceae bacterium]HCO60015.1 HAD-IB family hydrolase [Porticoccaceae bacterium]